MMDAWTALLLATVGVFGGGAGARADDAALRDRALEALRGAESGDVIKSMHAAEVLAWDGYGAEVSAQYRKQLPTAAGRARVVVWRVLAQSDPDPAARSRYVRLVRDAALDTKSPDAEFDLESLAKLGYAGRETPFVELAAHGEPVMKILARWVIANSGRSHDEAYLAELLDLPDSRNRGIAAYALRFLKQLHPETIRKLEAKYEAEPASGAGRVFFVTTLYTHGPARDRQKLKRELLMYADKGNEEARYQSLLTVGRWADREDLPEFQRYLSDPDADIRIAASHAILTTLRRRNP